MRNFYKFIWKWLKRGLKTLVLLIYSYCVFLAGMLTSNTEYTSKLMLQTRYYQDATMSAQNSIDAPKKVQEVYKRLKYKIIDNQGLANTVKIDDETFYAGVAIDGTIYVSPDFTKISDDAMAVILGHEIAHYQLRHTHPLYRIPRKHKYLEYHSDLLGLMYAKKAGYDMCKGVKVYFQWLDMYGQTFSSTHPSLVERIWYLNEYACEVKK